MTQLSVNLNKVALLRNTRHLGIPSLTRAADLCIAAGAHGITVHPRPDQRHIRPTDVYALAEQVTVELNIEGNPFQPPFMEIVRQVKPTQCTLVPDAPQTFTSDHGWDLTQDSQRLAPVIEALKKLGTRVSLFMDADPAVMTAVKQLGADRIELFTEPYAAAHDQDHSQRVFQSFAETAQAAQAIGLGVNAGHDLNLQNLAKFCTIPNILEVSIGHALIADALEMGLSSAVQAYLEILGAT